MPKFVIEREIPGAGKLTPEQLKSDLTKDSDLSVSEINAIISAATANKGEAVINGNEKTIAVALVKSQGFLGDAEKAKSYLRGGGSIQLNDKTVTLSLAQVEAIIREIDAAYPSGGRTFIQSILPGGR